VLAPVSVPWIAAQWGWQTAFIAIGAIGFMWMALWQLMYQPPELQKRLGKAELAYINSDAPEPGQVDGGRAIPWFRLLAYRQTWAFAFGKFMTDGVWWFFLFWLPKYLSAQYGMKCTDIMLPLAVLYSMTMVGSIGGGWLPTYFIDKGAAPYDGRMKAMLLIALCPLVVLLAQPLGYISVWVPVVLIGIGASAHQAWSANLFTTVSDMFPKNSVASVVGIGGMAGGIGGVLISKTGGWVFDYFGAQGRLQTGYTLMFAVCAVAYLLAWCVMKALVPVHSAIGQDPRAAAPGALEPRPQ
jgi:ACS family hexuronate transporter-like MFS transporter